MTLDGKMKTGEPLVQQAIEALRRYHEARDSSAPAEAVERLRFEAEWLHEAVGEHQRQALGNEPAATH